MTSAIMARHCRQEYLALAPFDCLHSLLRNKGYSGNSGRDSGLFDVLQSRFRCKCSCGPTLLPPEQLLGLQGCDMLFNATKQINTLVQLLVCDRQFLERNMDGVTALPAQAADEISPGQAPRPPPFNTHHNLQYCNHTFCARSFLTTAPGLMSGSCSARHGWCRWL